MSGTSDKKLHDTQEIEVVTLDVAEIVYPGTHTELDSSTRALLLLSLLIAMAIIIALSLVYFSFNATDSTRRPSYDTEFVDEPLDQEITSSTSTFELTTNPEVVAKQLLDDSEVFSDLDVNLTELIAEQADEVRQASDERAKQFREENEEEAKQALQEAREEAKQAAEDLREAAKQARQNLR